MSNLFHARLRADTADAHAALDARFMGGLRDARRYAVYLLGMHRLVAAFEADGRERGDTPVRSAPLHADLDALGLAPLAPATLVFESEAEWLGGLYVIEGSALGARMLLRDVQHVHPAAATGFLHAHALDPSRWRTTLARLEARPATDLPAMIAGATRTFALADASFALAEHRDRP